MPIVARSFFPRIDATATALVALGLCTVVLVLKTLRQPFATLRVQGYQQRKFSRPAAHWVQHAMDGAKRPANVSFKDFFYECYHRDIARGEAFENTEIPHNAPTDRRVRFVSFNVHFFAKGYSNVCLGSNSEEVLQIFKTLNADVILVQEVPQSALSKFKRNLASLGYTHTVSAGSSDIHVLPADSPYYPGERLHVMIAARLPLLRTAAVPMLNGHAAFAEVSLSTGSGPVASAAVYCVHLSVRCEPATRRREIEAVLRHAKDEVGHGLPTFIAGDMNQPNEGDYPAAEWQVIAKDMTRAKLPLTDGVMDSLRDQGLRPVWEVATLPRPLSPSSAWNAALVDYCYVSELSQSGIEIAASYFLHTAASDHLPLVVDVAHRKH